MPNAFSLKYHLMTTDTIEQKHYRGVNYLIVACSYLERMVPK